MDKYEEVLKKILLKTENKACFDCGVPSPKWASVNNAVFVCLNCAGKHRGLGVHISFIRSVTMDNWDMKQIKVLSKGGNYRLKMLLEEYGIGNDMNMEIVVKYNLKLMEYYRKLLRAEAFGEENPMKPDYTTALETIDNSRPITLVDNQNFISSQQCCSNSDYLPNKDDNSSNNHNSLLNSVGSFFGNTMTEIQNGISNMHIKDKANNFGKKAVNYMGEKTNDVLQSNIVQSIFQRSKVIFGGKDTKAKEKEKEESQSQAQIDFYRRDKENYSIEDNDTNDSQDKKIKKSKSQLDTNNSNDVNTKIDNIVQEQRENQQSDEQNIYNFFSPPTKEIINQPLPQQKDNVFDLIFDNNTGHNNTPTNNNITTINNNNNFEDIFGSPMANQLTNNNKNSGIEDLTEDIFKH